jgi:prevent-host-death family protein
MAVRVVPISETRARIADLIKEASDTGEPYFITQRSQATAVLLGIEQYNALLAQIETLSRQEPQAPIQPVVEPSRGQQLGELLSSYVRAAGKATI